MRQASKRVPDSAEKTVRRATRRHHSAEEKIRIVLEGLRGEDSIAELCRKEGINQNLYYRWSKEFLEAGKKRLAGDTAREATSDEVKELKAEARQLHSPMMHARCSHRTPDKNGVAHSGLGANPALIQRTKATDKEGPEVPAIFLLGCDEAARGQVARLSRLRSLSGGETRMGF
jgi:transposase